MQLYYSPASPYARKVLIVAHETGLADTITLLTGPVSPIEKDKAINRHNPAGKIPTLVTEAGEAIYDSRVIVEYLAARAGDSKLFPAGAERWKALVLQSLCDEALDACLLARYEQVLRPEPLRWGAWIEGQMHKIATSLDVLERDYAHRLAAHFDIGTIAAATLMGYLDFRFTDFDWRATRPHLAAWAAGIVARPSVAATLPKA
ncbi:MAG TPA: glutathione S-transferase [Beijerinckiaceae bacterium]|nr:glutathione S-transferase [Beijerinckiaceae bacterium]